MNTKLIPALGICLLGLAAFVTTSSGQVEPTPVPTAPPTSHPGRGHHPAIQHAIMALERAKADMEAASHDYGGHRADALAACDNAIAQLKLALQFSNGNPSGAGAVPTPTP